MFVKEAAKRLGTTTKAIHRHIERGTPLGKIFTLKENRRFCYAHDLRRFLK